MGNAVSTTQAAPSARERGATAAIIRMAERHLDEGTMKDSAALAYYDAIALFQNDEDVDAQLRALDSLSYSVGVFHSDYTRAAEMARVWG
jgi:hypothetical protein